MQGKSFLIFKKMADDELESIRRRRMAEMQQNGSGASEQEAANRARQEQEMKNSILSQCLDQSARARLANLAAAKPDKALLAESMLLQMAQTGQLRSKLNEEQLKSLLENISERTQKKTTVKFDRRRAKLDDSDEDF